MLKEHLKRYTKEIYPMHMPGHKGGRYRLVEDFYQVDVTEVPGTDHLYNPTGVLRDSMSQAEAFYKAKKSVYLVNGSTVGILSAVGGTTVKGDHILIARNCHQSVYNAVSLYELNPLYIYPKMTQWGLLGGIAPKEVESLLAANPKVVAFVMTSPTYEGFISDIPAIKEICDRYNVVLIVDEAHGAHLPYSPKLPPSALAAEAHVVIHSLHKTLPVVTGGAMMHLNLPPDMEASVLRTLARLQTSSPSYIMMANMDACMKKLGNNDGAWDRLLEDIHKMTLTLKKMKKLYALTDYASEEEAIVATDPLKSIILTKGTLEDGHWLAKHLRHRRRIQMELADPLHILGIITPADSGKSLQNYAKALIKSERKMKKGQGTDKTFKLPKVAKGKMMPCQAQAAAKEWVSLEAAIGRIAGDMLIPYPPGIPAVAPGEVITEGMAQAISKWYGMGMEILGIEEGRVCVVKNKN